MEQEALKDSEALFKQLRRFRLDLVGWVSQRLARDGLNVPQYTVLDTVNETGEVTMGRLSRRLGTTMGAATNLVDKLVYAGHVERKRSSEDRRVVKVSMTAQGRKLLERATADSAEFLGRFFGQLPADDRKVIVRSFSRIVQLMDGHGKEGKNGTAGRS